MEALKDMIYGKPVREAFCNESDLVLVNNIECRVLDKKKLKTKSLIDEGSVSSDVLENRVLLVGEKEVHVYNYETKKLIDKIAIENISTIKLSVLLAAVGFNDGKVAVYSVIGNKFLMNFNIFKNKIERLEFFEEKYLLVQSGNTIKMIDTIEKKVTLTINDVCVITHFSVNEYYCITTNVDNELKIYSMQTGKILHQLKLNFKVKLMKYDGDLIFILHDGGLNILRITLKTEKNKELKNIDKKIRVMQKKKRVVEEDKIEFEQYGIPNDEYNIVQFAAYEDDIFVIDADYDIHHFSLEAVMNGEVKIEEEKEDDEELDKIEDSDYVFKFLTVDDSMTMRLIIKNTLLKNFKNIEVYEADDGYKCLDVLKEHPDIDVIFMDWNMPNLNGADTVDKIREKDIYKNIKIIMATTEGAKDKVRQMINKGVKGYLVKPFKPETITPLAKKMIEMIKEEKNV